ncbi:MAG: sugar transferase [Flavobacteriaceae bacterium]|nr:sugar transferase [Flavobacteriaceae bacterium]|tara:strand:- start:254 stop:841 length:588 start_codon:yes stop_codon:yes gene_type:complete
MLTQKQKIVKRGFDILLSLLFLPIILIPLLILWILSTLSTGCNGWYVQLRIGQHGKPFSFYKLRTLKGENHKDINEIKAKETAFGGWLRKTKLDEIPQLFNVLKGDMSWVGPRPDISGYADMLKEEDRVILSVKPGITGPATIKYKNEDQLLLRQSNPLEYNDTVIWPDKVKMNKEYIQQWSFKKDLWYLWRSIF